MNGESTRAAISELGKSLANTGYLADDSITTVLYLAQTMGRPLLLEGEPGTGKTALAEAVAGAMSLPLIRLQCYEGIDSTQALYDWDFPRQILHVRAMEATAPYARAEPTQAADLMQAEDSLYNERFLLVRPLLRALRDGPAVLLIDEIDRADDEFEAFLLEILSAYQVTIPELGTITAEVPPIVILTSNRTRELHDALKRRCLYHWIDHPEVDREVAIVRSRAPEVSEALARQLVELVQRVRHRDDLIKPPGVAETIDWAKAVSLLSGTTPEYAAMDKSLGALIKHREDLDRFRDALATGSAPRG